MDYLFTSENILNLMTLTGLEIILGIDNVIFIALLVAALPPRQRHKMRLIGLGLALFMRILMLFAASWMIGLTEPLFYVTGYPVSGRNILLVIGGLFLVVKSIKEIVEMFHPKDQKHVKAKEKYWQVVSQIVFIDLILSFDSIITAVGMSNDLVVIMIAIFIAIIVMLISSEPIGNFIEHNPSIKVIALGFIFLVGGFLMASGMDIDIPKGYLYGSMGFSMLMETINIMLKKHRARGH